MATIDDNPFRIELNNLLSAYRGAEVELTTKDPEIASLECIKSKSIIEADNGVVTATHYVILKAEKQVVECSSCNYGATERILNDQPPSLSSTIQACNKPFAMQFGFTVRGWGYYCILWLDRDVKITSETDDSLKQNYILTQSSKVIIIDDIRSNILSVPPTAFSSVLENDLKDNTADVIYNWMTKGKMEGCCYTIEITPTKFNKSGDEEMEMEVVKLNIPHNVIAKANDLDIVTSRNTSFIQLTSQESSKYLENEKKVLNLDKYIVRNEIFKIGIIPENVVIPVSSNETFLLKKRKAPENVVLPDSSNETLLLLEKKHKI